MKIALKLALIDSIIFVIGGILFFGFTNFCRSTSGNCYQPAVVYTGGILLIYSIAHLIYLLALNLKTKSRKR